MKTKNQTSTALRLLGRTRASALICSTIAVAGVSWISLTTGQAQTVISVDFYGNGTQLLAPDDTAGATAYEASHWNLVSGDTTSTPVVMNDSTGTATNVSLSSVNLNGGIMHNYGGTPTTGNHKLYNGGLLKDHWSAGGITFTLTNLDAFSSYDLIVYLVNDTPGSQRLVNVSTSADANLTYYANPASDVTGSAFTQITSTDSQKPTEGNYVVFSGLTATTLTTTVMTPSDMTGITGFQIIGNTGTGQPDPFGPWIATNYPDLADKTAAGDPDGDGMNNQQEFAFGLDPSSGASVSPITTQLDKATGTFSYIRRDPAVTNLTYTVMTSTNLVDWVADAGATSSQTVAATSNGVQTMAVTLSGVPLDMSQLFVRVKAQ